jgi:hypothetical protein
MRNEEMTLDEFKESLAEQSPPELSGPLMALWWAAKGDWEQAHTVVQDDSGRSAAWVHAHLHRVEGDHSNAAYWYRNAGRPVARGELSTEWEAIVADLLAALSDRK